MTKRKKPELTNILFIGNSFTQRNNLPGLVAGLAADCGIEVRHDLVAAGGASLRLHWNAGRALQLIKTGKYDLVVLQEQSTLPVKNATRMAENVRLFDTAIQEAGAKTVLYMTWARQNAPETQQAITDAYTSIGQELGAIVVPVGLVWQRFLQEQDGPALYDRDGSHPTLAGSYLAACVFLATIWRTAPRELAAGPPALGPADRRSLQDAARRESNPKCRE